MQVKLRHWPPPRAIMIHQLRDLGKGDEARMIAPVHVDKVPVLYQATGEQTEVDNGENKVEAEDLEVVPDICEGELAGDGGAEVLGRWCSADKPEFTSPHRP